MARKQIYEGSENEFYNPQNFSGFIAGKKFREVEIKDGEENQNGRNVYYSNSRNVTVVHYWDASHSSPGSKPHIFSSVTLLGRKEQLSKVEKMILEVAKENKVGVTVDL
jgi:hypothetical protein